MIIRINKNFHQAKKNLGLVLLLKQNFSQGFLEFESRTKDQNKKEYQKIKLQGSSWSGQELDEKNY